MIVEIIEYEKLIDSNKQDIIKLMNVFGSITEKNVEQAIKQDNNIFVAAYKNNRIIGITALVEINLFTAKLGIIDEVVVSKEFQRKGVASKIMQKIIEIAKEKKIDLLKVDIMREKLINKYKILESYIDVRVSKANTQGNAIAINLYFSENPDLHQNGCAFLTNFYHIPRASRMFWDECNLRLRAIAAESLLWDREINREKILEIYTSSNMYTRFGSEFNGLKEWEFSAYLLEKKEVKEVK